jgi:hypothetical protein
MAFAYHGVGYSRMSVISRLSIIASSQIKLAIKSCNIEWKTYSYVIIYPSSQTRPSVPLGVYESPHTGPVEEACPSIIMTCPASVRRYDPKKKYTRSTRMTSSEPAQETHNYSQCDPIRIEPPLKLPPKSKAKQSRAKPNQGILKLPIQNLKDTDNMALSTHGPGLQQRQLRAKQVPLLLHFKLDDAGLAAQAQHLADAGARRGVAVRRRVARQGTEGRCRRRGDAAGGARGAESGA